MRRHYHSRRHASRFVLWISLLALLLPTSTVLALESQPVEREHDGWIIQLRESALDGDGAVMLESAAGDAILDPIPGLNGAYVARFAGRTSSATVLAQLERNPAVEYVEPDYMFHYQFEPNDPLFAHQVWARAVNLPDAWDVSGGSEQVTVAVIDSGVRSDHPDLVDRLVPGYNFINHNLDTNDVVGHGTSVAGLVAAAGNNGVGISGTAMNVRIMPVRVGTSEGSPVSRIAAGMIFAVDNGADVVNLSLGSFNDSATLQSVLRYAYQNNVAVVAASGNIADEVTFPASYPEAISVGATLTDGSGLSDFTSRLSRVDLVAPGVDVLTTHWSASDGNTYAWRSGTSFAAPIVSGTVALMLSLDPTLSIEQIRGILTTTAQWTVQPGEPGVGAGLLDSGAAVRRTLLPRFGTTWLPADQPVAMFVSERTWIWGPHAFHVGAEPYTDAENSRRLVAYFDKSRMEITDPYGDASSAWHVTNGLLVNEMISGNLQLGNATFEHIGPANFPVAGDPDDPFGPFYSSFIDLRETVAPEQGAVITQSINRAGDVGNSPELTVYGVTAAELSPETGHRVASVFWQYLNSTGPVYSGGEYLEAPIFNPPFYATGYPVTDAYWARVMVAGVVQDVLIQCFERRCLTYTPANSPAWQVEMGNVGLHYYRWRFGVEPGGASSEDPTALALAWIR